MTAPMYAIYRHAKLKSVGLITASSEHMARTRDTPNADPARLADNLVLIGTEDPAADVTALVPGLKDTNASGARVRRTNSVLAIEVLLTASPEWWAQATPDDQQAWLDNTVGWLVAEYGRENIAHLRMHGDEATPHLTGFVVPLDPETGRLNARRWIGGPQRCAQQQSDYAASVASLGLQRGIEGSVAHHESVKRHHAQINKPHAKLTLKSPPRILWDPEGWAAEQRQTLGKQIAPTMAKARTADSDRTAKKAALAQATKDRNRADRAEKALDEQKAIAARMRALALPDVLHELGFAPNPRKPGFWRYADFNITLGSGDKEGKWYDHFAERGRGGAIDLVQHVTGSDFKGALAWLADRFGEGAAVADYTAAIHRTAQKQVTEAMEEREPFTPPAPAPEHWQHVRNHLTSVRALPRKYIDRLHELGDVYADAKRNAVFVCRDPETSKIVGAELKGTYDRPEGRFSGMAPGSRKDLGAFRIGDFAKATTVYLAESAIDAISLFKLRQDAGERGHAVLSMAGHKTDLPDWLSKLKQVIRRVCGYDNDKVGDKAGAKLAGSGWEREAPAGKDWNDDLVQLTKSQGDGTATRNAALDETHEDDGPTPPTP